MAIPMQHPSSAIIETLSGIVDRVTYHNAENGWSVLRVTPFNNPHQQETVVVHQTKVFAGATMAFQGAWTSHPKFGRQFKAVQAVEKKPATAAALEKYLGSGLIKGVGPRTAHKIVRHFGDQTLDIFESTIERLTEIRGIALKKLEMIRDAWAEHRTIRDVMMFLQSHGISTLFAVRIYKAYGDEAIARVAADPYCLAADIYGIGFFSADRVARSIGIAPDSPERIKAGIAHVLAASREFGHCYLTGSQIHEQVRELLGLDPEGLLPNLLQRMQEEKLLMRRDVQSPDGTAETGYYARSLYFDELCVAGRIGSAAGQQLPVDSRRVAAWIDRFCQHRATRLSDEQAAAVLGIAQQRFSILTGGPGCGKTTTTLVLVRLLEAMGRKVLLAAPTGRAAQRMMDVIGNQSKTIHRLLEWRAGTFKRNEEQPLETDFLIVDECSMLDISLTAALLRAVPQHSQVLFIGDADQLPSVGAGNVLRDMIASEALPCFRLTQIFRQARESLIVLYAHQINTGEMPRIDSPFKAPELWTRGTDCLFIDSDEATREQIDFIAKIRKSACRQTAPKAFAPAGAAGTAQADAPPPADTPLPTDAPLPADPYEFRTHEVMRPHEYELTIPPRFQHVDLARLIAARTHTDELLALLRKVHPWSALHYGLTASGVVLKLYKEWIPRYYGGGLEIQVITPMTRGSLGAVNLNKMIQAAVNPPGPGKNQLQVGERILRAGDRVIHRRNNYDLGVFNGDIGVIRAIDNQELTCEVSFYPDGRAIHYERDDIPELDLSYAITIHKAQGSEFGAVIMPVLSQHFKMLFRNLVYTGLTRARKLAVLVGTRKALAMAVRNQDTSRRQTSLKELLRSGSSAHHAG